ncbi:hypothetical protein AV530_008620 [Patagioenas fasciata monilis]|uniref:Uncharacterized protein n=1 Tax=Patagioenas fasciata monilis TaxID=372326 RepID=A0A1V4L1B8_PATFA|nr:hypothetical protein AV530_008620 [Patagioenas fasciata monilis]
MFAVQRRGGLGCGSRFLRAPSSRKALLCGGRERNGSASREEEEAVLAGVVWIWRRLLKQSPDTIRLREEQRWISCFFRDRNE